MSRFESDILEGFEMDAESEASEASEAAEAIRRRPPVASGKGLTRPRPTPGGASYVSRVEFQAAMARVGDQIKKNSDAILAVNTKTAALLATAKKEMTERKKQSESTNKDLNSKLQMLALLPLLVRKSPVTLTTALPGTDSSGAPAAVNVVTPADTSSLDAILPLLLVSGMGGSSGGLNFGGDSGSSESSTMMLLILALALSGGLK